MGVPPVGVVLRWGDGRRKHIFLQVADLVATLRFIELKMRAGLPMTKSEYRFFGGPRRFKHDVLRAIKDHWLL